jgi:nicotinate-nucleotide adenylyltransferase
MTRDGQGTAEPGRGGVGIFGGTFNPIHAGHLRAAEAVLDSLGLARMIFMPSAAPPHKSASDDDPIAPAAERLAWVRAALADHPRCEVDPLEIERGGRSYTVDTLRTIGERIAPQLPVFVIGHDAFLDVGTWREPEVVFRLAHFAVIVRPPAAMGSLADWLPKCVRDDFIVASDGLSGKHRSAGTWIRLLEIPALDVSASDIRARLRVGRSVRGLVPEAVREAVQRSGVYARG